MNTMVSVYHQIKQSIKGWITNKEFNSGDKIPTEMELVAQFTVNRLTVHQATAQLIQEGLPTSKRGEGAFVTKHENFINSLRLEFTGFMDKEEDLNS